MPTAPRPYACGLTRFACQTAVQEKDKKDRQSRRPAWSSLTGHKWSSLGWPSGLQEQEAATTCLAHCGMDQPATTGETPHPPSTTLQSKFMKPGVAKSLSRFAQPTYLTHSLEFQDRGAVLSAARHSGLSRRRSVPRQRRSVRRSRISCRTSAQEQRRRASARIRLRFPTGRGLVIEREAGVSQVFGMRHHSPWLCARPV